MTLSERGLESRTSRDMQAYKLARQVYDAARETIAEAEPDAGIGIAACALVGQWLSASATAQVIAFDPSLANVPYFRDKRNDVR